MPTTSLSAAVREFTAPGAHLHFASTPSRSNAAIIEIARAYRDSSPGFTLSTSGFHSVAHLLPLLRLGQTYQSCFFGDNYPRPRPNRLYTAVDREGATLEHWSLAWYVAALRAGAQGQPYALVHEPDATTLGAELAKAGRLASLPASGPAGGGHALIRALRPDVTFLHAPFADHHGRVVLTAPYGEGLWGALAARCGIVATVEHIVAPSTLDRLPAAIHLPPHRVLAVCARPGGTHPQPLHIPVGAPAIGIGDDFEHYLLWRTMAQRDALSSDFTQLVLQATDAALGYEEFRRCLRPAASEAPPDTSRRDAVDLALVRAARVVVGRVLEQGHRVLVAGIGRSFDVCRLAHRLLSDRGVHVPIMFETGLYDVDSGVGGFPLGLRVAAAARRRTSIEDILETLACGAGNRCLAVIGAAQIDPTGAVNSTRLADGTVLVGSGGAHDLGAGADEVVVIADATPDRLPTQVDYLTSSGRAVLRVVTNAGVFCRNHPGDRRWSLREWTAPDEPRAGGDGSWVARVCAWTPTPELEGPEMTAITDQERHALAHIREHQPPTRRHGSHP